MNGTLLFWCIYGALVLLISYLITRKQPEKTLESWYKAISRATQSNGGLPY